MDLPVNNNGHTNRLYVHNIYDNKDDKITNSSWSTSNYKNINLKGKNLSKFNMNVLGLESNIIDLWTTDNNQLRVKLVDFGNNNVYQGGDDSETEINIVHTPNQWNSLDIDLLEFTNVTKVSQLIMSSVKSTLDTNLIPSDIYLGNVYFY